jgi:hypothetical protein
MNVTVVRPPRTEVSPQPISEWGEAEYRTFGRLFIALALVLLACAGGGVWLLVR